MSKASTSTVVKQLEEETQVPRDGTMRIPKEKIKWIEYCLDKHGDDYEVSFILSVWHLMVYNSLSSIGHGQGQEQPLSGHSSTNPTKD